MRMAIFSLFIVSLILGGCTSNKDYRLLTEDTEQSDGDTKVTKQVSDEEYQDDMDFAWKIAKGDRVEITVFNQSSVGGQQLTQLLSNAGSNTQYQNRDGYEGILIQKEGMVRLPLVGEVKVTGLTESEAELKLTEAYSKFLRHPFVSITIRNQKLFVLGEVKQPGVLQVPNGTMTLFEALASTGDLTDDAKRTDILILRGDMRNPTVKEVDLTDMSAIRLSSLILQPNDVVYVQPRTMKAINKNFTDQLPFFQLITQMLTPFVQLEIIKEGYGIHTTGQ